MFPVPSCVARNNHTTIKVSYFSNTRTTLPLFPCCVLQQPCNTLPSVPLCSLFSHNSFPLFPISHNTPSPHSSVFPVFTQSPLSLQITQRLMEPILPGAQTKQTGMAVPTVLQMELMYTLMELSGDVR